MLKFFILKKNGLKTVLILTLIVMIFLNTGCSFIFGDTEREELPSLDESENISDDSSLNISEINNTYSSEKTPEVNNESNSNLTEFPEIVVCHSEQISLTLKDTESPSMSALKKLETNNWTYELLSFSSGRFSVDKYPKKSDTPVLRIVIPTGIYTPQNAVKIDDTYAIKIINKSFERIDGIYYNSSVLFELYYLNETCSPPQFEKEPLIVLDCIVSNYIGDCIFSRNEPVKFGISTHLTENFTFSTMSLSIDDSGALIPTINPEFYFKSFGVEYSLPEFAFYPGDHIIKLDFYDGSNLIYSKKYAFTVLQDNQIAIHLFSRAKFCNTNNTADFIRYYSDSSNGAIIRHDYYPANLTLTPGGCIESKGMFSACDTGKIFYGYNANKILSLNNINSFCEFKVDIPETCYNTFEIVEGQSFYANLNQQYVLLKIFSNPKIVALKNVDRNWIEYYPYDVPNSVTSRIKLTSYNSNTLSVKDQDVFCNN